ncbi:alpha/beta hydrolase family protein [Burkholderia pseudomallei TSV 43]|nr:alpha/beta hydrolase family protein [Burkholderia pseudomallei TSV 43]
MCRQSNRPQRIVSISLFILLVAVLSLFGCGKQSDPTRSDGGQAATTSLSVNNEDPQWVSRDSNKPAKIAIVFVHGIFGTTTGTWTNDNGRTFFQLLKADPDVGPYVDIYAFGFESKMFGGTGSLDVREGANKLKTYLYSAHVLDYPAVVFVGHSMGGLVVLRYLASNLDKDDSLAAKVSLVTLYGSPQEGAQIASIAKLVLSNPALAHMKPVDDNQWLQQLTDDWTNTKRKPHVVCGYEKAPTYGVMIVPWSSSNRFCTEPGVAIDGANHIDMVKPDRPAHPSVVLLTSAIRRYVLPVQFGTRLETPDFVRDGDDWHFVMDSSAKTARVMNLGTANLTYWFAEKTDPALYIVPDDGPATVAGNSIQNVKLLLLANAKEKQYSFRLKTSANDDEHVIVDVPDLERVRQQTAALSKSIVADMNSQLASIPADKASPEVLATTAYKTVEKNLPDLPPAAKWVITADVLSATSMDKIAAVALNRANAESPKVVHSTSVQDVATRVQRGTTDQQILFEVPRQKRDLKVLDPTAKFLPNQKSGPDTVAPVIFKIEGASPGASLELAERMKRIPSLAGTGFTLEGAVKSATGDSKAANVAFKKALMIEPTPALKEKMAKPQQ